MSAGERFVRKSLANKSSALLVAKTDRGVFQFEYKVQISPAARNLLLLEKGFIQVPRWIVYFTLISLVFLITFFSASLFVLGNSKPGAIYLQSCSDRQCSSALGLKCINKTCQCESPKYYKKKCIDLSKYDESCITTSNCEPSQVLTCIGSICKCEFNMYWDSSVSMCVDRLTYGDKCTGDQCEIKLDMKCGSSGTCECTDPSTMFWSNSYQSCIPKRKYSQTCESDNQCQDSQLTICKNNSYCLCVDSKYFNGVNCVERVGEFVNCTIDDMCLMPMYCSSSTGCTCDPYYFYDSLSSTCVAQYTYNSGPCTTNHNCRSDLNLLCETTTNLCVCTNSTTLFWSNTNQSCIPKRTHNQTCESNDQCLSSELTICKYNSTCLCIDTMYFNGVNCVDRVGEFVNCTFNDMCLMPMTCSSTVGCTCLTNYFFNSTSGTCEPKYTYNTGPCTTNHNCRSDLHLICDTISSLCVCDSTKYTYSTSDSACKLTYVKGTCTTDTDCNSSEDLICSTGTDVCTCPTATTSGNCDCIRISGNEKYWDSSSNKCVTAKTLNGTCTSNYMCQTKTLNLECNSTTGLCECPQPGGILSNGTCRKCQTGEIFYNDLCYYFSPSGDTCTATQIISVCSARGGKPAILDTTVKLTFASQNTNLNDQFWISGEKLNKNQGVAANYYHWGVLYSSTPINTAICNPILNNDCLIYVRNALNCFNGETLCTQSNRYICQS